MGRAKRHLHFLISASLYYMLLSPHMLAYALSVARCTVNFENRDTINRSAGTLRAQRCP